MRELQLYPKKRKLPDLVRRLQFRTDGAELFAWTDENPRTHASEGHRVYSSYLYACPLAGDAVRRLDQLEGRGDWGGPVAPPAVSADGRCMAGEIVIDGTCDSVIAVVDLHQPDKLLPEIPTTQIGFAGLFFTPDGSELIAVRTGVDSPPDVARFALAQLTAPPKRYVTRPNPFTGKPMQVAVRNLKWKYVLPQAPWDTAVSAALSANGQMLAVEDEEGAVHIVDIKKKYVPGRLLVGAKNDGAGRIGFDPAAKWLVRVTNDRLSARALAGHDTWAAKTAFGKVTDFAFHPDGHLLCAVFADGQARFLDPNTGEQLRAFKWGKRALHAVAFSPDGLTCAAGGVDGKIVIWDVDN